MSGGYQTRSEGERDSAIVGRLFRQVGANCLLLQEPDFAERACEVASLANKYGSIVPWGCAARGRAPGALTLAEVLGLRGEIRLKIAPVSGVRSPAGKSSLAR